MDLGYSGDVRPPSDITRILQGAAKRGHIETFKYFISKEEEEYYHLHLREAVYNGQQIIIEYFAKGGYKSSDGNIMLHTVCDSNPSPKTIKCLIDNGESINAPNENGDTPLFMAIYSYSDLHIIEYLVSKGADINWENKSHKTPLSCAVTNYQEKYIDVINFLLEKGARISENAPQLIKKKVTFFKEPKQFNLNHIENGLPALHNAIKSSDLKWAKFLVRQGADVNLVAQGKAPLHVATELRQVQIVEFLLQYGAIFDQKCSKGNTPRMLCNNLRDNVKKIIWLFDVLAVLFRSQHLMKDLNEKLLEQYNDWGPYGKGYSDAWDGDNPTLFILNARNITGKTLLHVASDTNNDDAGAIRKLLEFNRDYLKRREESIKYKRYRDYQSMSIDTLDYQNNAPLHLAAQKGHIKIVGLLLEKGAIFNKGNSRGETPELLATNNGHNNIVELFQPLNNLFIAVEKNNSQEIEKLIQQTAYINAKNQDGRSLLHFAAFLDHPNIIKMLLIHGGDTEAVDSRKNKAIHIATENNKIENIKILLQNGAMFNAKNANDQTPFDMASGQIRDMLKDINTIFEEIRSDNPRLNMNHMKKMQRNYHIDIKTIVNIRDNQLNTLLHYACQLGEFNIVKELLKNGAIFNAPNIFKKKPKDITKSKDIIRLLEAIEQIFENYYTVSEEQNIVDREIIRNVRIDSGNTILRHCNVETFKFLRENKWRLRLENIRNSPEFMAYLGEKEGIYVEHLKNLPTTSSTTKKVAGFDLS